MKTGTGEAKDRRHLIGVVGALALPVMITACGGGGSTRSDPPPVTPPPTGIGFTPNIENDSSLTVNPPAVPSVAGPATLPQYSRHLELTNAAGAIGAGLTGAGVTIGFLDTGVNRDHPALDGRVTRHFINVNPNTNDMSVDDKDGHGTIVASIAAGKDVGNWGGGVAQGATVVSSRIISDEPPEDDGSGEGNEIGAGQGYGDYFKALNAQLGDAGARIINNSWGGLYWNDSRLTTELANAWRDFVVDRGGIIVFANGNSGRDPRFVDEPSDNAQLPTLANDSALEKGWLTVGALDPDNPTQLTDYSQRCGSAMNYCLVAPGNVVFIDPDAATGDSSYDLYQGGGTSFSAPQVSGAAAVVWSAFPYFDNDLVRQTLLGGAQDLGDPGVDAVFGWGLLDVTKASRGPSNFAWGDVTVSLSENSFWRNQIVGDGGLVKNGSGTLTLTETAFYTGDTRVQAGGLSVRQGLAGNVSVASGGTVWGSGRFGGNVDNSGKFFSGSSTPATVAGNYVQSSSGNLGVWLGSTMQVNGSATLAGQLSILGVRSGYTTTSRETLLTANGGVSGTFGTVRAASNVFLEAAVAYAANDVFLDITRINVANAVAGLSMPAITGMSAIRVETALAAIDAQLGGASSGGSGGIGNGFIDAAGALQHSADNAVAERSLRSLSGQLHAASTSMTLDALDAGRRTLDQRIDLLSQAAHVSGGWHRDLGSSGMLARSGFDSIGVDTSGEIIGNDWRLGRNAVMGLSTSRMRQNGRLDDFGDRSRGWQQEMQAYAAMWRGPWHFAAQVASGEYDRHLQRNLMLGTLSDVAASRVSGRYQSYSAEAGRRFELAGATLVPYFGSQYARIDDDGFEESGMTGFGLRANPWEATRWHAFAGLRGERAWDRSALRAYAEWQQTLDARGFDLMASFTGVDSWSPLPFADAARSGGRFGLGFDHRLGRNANLSLDFDQRFGPRGNERMAMLQYLLGF